MEIAFIIIVIHYIADFIFQDEKWAINKSKDFDMLLQHTATYSILWFIPMLFLLPREWPWEKILIDAIIFTEITFIMHTLTDFFTSKVTSKLYAAKKFGSSIPNLGFFSMIGFDQVLHYAQLFLTYWFLTKSPYFI